MRLYLRAVPIEINLTFLRIGSVFVSAFMGVHCPFEDTYTASLHSDQ